MSTQHSIFRFALLRHTQDGGRIAFRLYRSWYVCYSGTPQVRVGKRLFGFRQQGRQGIQKVLFYTQVYGIQLETHGTMPRLLTSPKMFKFHILFSLAHEGDVGV